MEMPVGGNDPRAVASPPTRDEVELHVHAVLASPPFANSPRCQEFLRYVVEHALAGEADAVKERSIAMDVFGLGLEFEPAENSVVRVKAAEVRKRLAKYYQHGGAGSTIRIILPPGRYAPEFQCLSAAPPAHRRRFAFLLAHLVNAGRRDFLVAGLVVCAAVVLVVLSLAHTSTTPLEELWRPFLQDGAAPVICLVNPTHLALAGQHSERIAESKPSRYSPFGVPIYSGNGHDLVVIDWALGVGESRAAIAVASFLAAHKKQALIKVGRDVSFPDLRAHPAVLVGGPFASKWTLEMGRDLPFVFRTVPDSPEIGIVEIPQPHRVWTVRHILPNGHWEEDYSIAAHLIDSKSGQAVIIVAGISTFGAQSAAEFLVTPAYFLQLLKHAPKNWQSRNFAALLHSVILSDTPAPPELVAVHFW